MNDVTKGLLRHVLTGVGGVLVSKGVLSAEDLSTVIGGLLTLVGIFWSVASKKTTNSTQNT